MQKTHTNDAISPVISVCLMFVLVAVLVGIVFLSVYGFSGLLFAAPSMAADANAKLVPEKSFEVIEFTPMAGSSYIVCESGDPADSGESEAEISFCLVSPDGGTYTVGVPDDVTLSSSYGSQLYIYGDFGNNYMVTDSMDSIDKDRASEFSSGEWTLQVVDLGSNLLLGSIPVQLNGVSTDSPKVWWNFGAGWNVTNSTGSTLQRTDVGNVVTNPSGGPGNTTSVTLDGDSYIQVPDNPDLDFEDDMSLSLWMKPDRLDGDQPYFNIVGKGKSDVDNFDLFLVNGQLWFEWTEPSGQHYHVQSTDATISTADWNYVAVVVEDNDVKLYQGDSELNLQWYDNPVIGSPPIAAPVEVNLQPNDDPLHIGRQDHGAWDFMYEGDIGEIAFYSYGLSEDEVANNNENNQS